MASRLARTMSRSKAGRSGTARDGDPLAAHGRSDRTRFALAAAMLPQRWRLRADAAFQRGENAVLYGLAAGLRFPARATPPSHAHARLILVGHLDVPVQEALRRTVPPGGVVYDVGANVGFFTVLAARLVGDAGHVVAFEPIAAAANLAREAALRSDLADRVEVRTDAVGARSGTARMCSVAAGGIWSHMSTVRDPHPLTIEEVDVPLVSLDDVIAAGAPAPDVVKLDVEGAEGDVLRGAQRLLAEHRPIIVCELHDTNDEVADLLEAAGYVLEALDGATPVRQAGPSHVLARPGPT
ncbi:MAG: FkbM family methyltransferase [Actinomycetota bacterium]|nr:FkbM family methyltransferase [Actinomycetota bacterium]